MSAYEEERQKNIAKNKQLLAELGLDKPFFEPKVRVASVVAKKRKSTKVNHQNSNESKPVETPSVTTCGPRRSQRNLGKPVDYTAERDRPLHLPSQVREVAVGREKGTRVHDPKKFGAIPGIAVGTWWESREDCSIDAVHAPWVAGISASPKGAYSVALSGGYDDDVDLGYAFTYTGSGGRDLKGTKAAPKNLRTGPQSSDQTFENPFNRALLMSSKTKNPVRVIRGYKLKSPYAPAEGYRYDGLYTVEKAWIEKGLNPQGYLVCKFAFKRIDGQFPLLERENDPEDNVQDVDLDQD